MIKIGFIGAGTVGTALAFRLSDKGYPVVAVASRNHTSARNLAQAVKGCRAVDTNQQVADAAELVFVVTPDDSIAPVVADLRWHPGQSVVHCSGVASTDILEPARRAGAYVGTFHPLQTFAGVKQAIENIPGSTFGIEAEEPLLTTLRNMAEALEGKWIKLEASDKVLYHASAVIACNYLVALVKLATDLWETFDVPREVAIKALMPLLKGTLHNVETVGIPNCLTGPIARGDIGTIKKHLEALEKASPELASTYRALGLQTIPIALAKGKITPEKAEELEVVLKESARVGINSF